MKLVNDIGGFKEPKGNGPSMTNSLLNCKLQYLSDIGRISVESDILAVSRTKTRIGGEFYCITTDRISRIIRMSEWDNMGREGSKVGTEK